MSTSLFAASPDLRRLRDEGFDVSIVDGHLVVGGVPYATRDGEVEYGTLISTLNLAGEATAAPDTHVINWVGEYPCNENGQEIQALRHSGGAQLTATLKSDFRFSNKPAAGFANYYDKVVSYVNLIEGYAVAIDSGATARTYPPIPAEPAEGPFEYLDTASSRAGITALNMRVHEMKIAIIGLGGTGSYILDLVAKTSVAEINLWDGDDLLQHNAFRAPGAVSLATLRRRPKKVSHYAKVYGALHRGVRAHGTWMAEEHLGQLASMDFVFIAIDDPAAKAAIFEELEGHGVPFIDCGMGLELRPGGLAGQIRVTSSTPTTRDAARRHVTLVEPNSADEYRTNVQTPEANALNAALAVFMWKRLIGYYEDQEHEVNAVYTTDGNCILRAGVEP